MQKTCKRKQLQLDGHSQKTPKTNTEEPYPSHHRPTLEECRAVRDELLALHGFPREFLKYRRHRLIKMEPLINEAKSEPLINSDYGDDKEESVLDGLVKTVLSQNTTELNSQKAFASLKSVLPTWEDVHAAESKTLENAIKCGGLAPRKASCIKNLLSCLHERKGKLCLEYLRDLSIDEVKSELSNFKGVGPKTVACVLMFNLQQDDFPVDTHVFEIARAIGWVPAIADRNKTYLHLNQRIPNELKFDLNCLLYTHGRENSLDGSEEENDSGKSSEKKLSMMGKTVTDESVTRKLEKRKYECQFCPKKFTNSQALGGLLNAHKSERLKMRRMQLEPKTVDLSFADEPPKDYSVASQHCSLPSSNYFSSFVTEFTLFKDVVINSESFYQNQNLYCNMAELRHSFPWSSHDSFEGSACGWHIVIKPSPSYISKDCPSLYNQLGLAPPDIHSSSRNGHS